MIQQVWESIGWNITPPDPNNPRTRRGPRPTKEEKLEALNKAYTFGVVHRGRDNFETFILEGITIKDRKPDLNSMLSNGFII